MGGNEMLLKTAIMTATVLTVTTGVNSARAESILVGHLADQSGPTSDVGVPYAQGVIDALAHMNAKGGVNGATLAAETVDYGYQAPRAISQYKKWSAGSGKIAALQGWGTADTEALTGFIGKDEIPDFSGSYSAHLTDPLGKGPRGSKPAPYNFFYGPSYSDSLRAMLMWAAEDWKKKGGAGKPKYAHMGANHPYPNAPKEAGEQLARELGFDVLPSIQFALTPGDYTAQCLTLKESGVNYAYLGNTGGSNISVLKACQTIGAKVQFMGNVWGMDENAAKAAGAAANGVIFPVRTAVTWAGDAPGMKMMRDISRISDPSGAAYRPVHYLAGVCTVFYMKEAMDWASKNGGVTGANIRKGMHQKKDWVPAGLEGVCVPSSWSEDDHRGTTAVNIYRVKVSGDTTAPIDDLVKAGSIELQKIGTTDVPRKPEWLGW
jgi:branched-chain amino acid transport system substrate-binding protein